MSTIQPVITLIICSFNRRESLLQTLETVAKQRCSVAWEVLIVDNAGTDGTADAVSQLVSAFPVPLRVIREEKRGRSYALNRAIEAANGNILIFTDDDIGLQPGFVAGHAAVYEDPDVGAAGGRIVPVMPENTPNWLRELCEKQNGGIAGRYDWGGLQRPIEEGDGIHLPYGGNMSFRRELATRLGGFRVDLGWGTRLVPGEESDLFERFRRAGVQIVYQPDSIAEHRFQPAKATLEYFLQFEAGCARAVVLRSAIAPIRRLRWIARSLLDILYYTAKSMRGSQDPNVRLEYLQLRARARGSLAQLLFL